MPKITHSIALSFLLGVSALSANSENLATSLMQLRSEVETLDNTITQEKESYRASIKSLMRQKDDLESVIAREDLKIKQIEQELDKVRKEIVELSKNTEGLKPLVFEALELISKNIASSIPFKTKERLLDVESIESQLRHDLITPQKALAFAWNVYTDALRMTKENGVFKQTITLDGEARLAEVARVGTMMMFFKTPDNHVGYVVKQNNDYSYKEVFDKDAKEQIVTLFDAFKKQIRSGYFTLPNAIVSMENN